MRYWWVNHNQTFREETEGKFIWAPKTQKGGKRSHFYDNMTRVKPGDIVFSFASRQICGYGKATSAARSAVRPDIFKNTGKQWDVDGWRVDVDFRIFPAGERFRPKDSIDEILALHFLPAKYSPMNSQGDGNQGAYLAEISPDFADYLLDKLGQEAERGGEAAPSEPLPTSDLEEVQAELEILRDPRLTPTQQARLVASRVGQGTFRRGVLKLGSKCRLTGIDNPDFLIASHIKPWKVCNNDERLDPYNGLMLTPNADRLFDRGLISFGDDGELLVAESLDPDVLAQLGLPRRNVGPFQARQAVYLQDHRVRFGFAAE